MVGCNSSDNQQDKNVRVANSGVFTPIEIKINGEEISSSFSLGEYVTASEKVKVDIEIRNNTNYSLEDISVSFPGRVSKFYDFYSTGSEEVSFPGEDGTCGTSLASKSTCKITLGFSTNKSGVYAQNVNIEFKNLVERDQKTVNFSVLAGQPASLIFDDGSSNSFFFGNKVGAAQKPVLERSEVATFSKSLRLSNQGELTARDIIFNLPFNCSSSDDNFLGDLTNYTGDTSPAKNFCDAWVLTHNCPQALAPGAECDLKVEFTPLNQDQSWGFDQGLEELYYTSTVDIGYKDTPNVTTTSLKGNFETYSTTIGAKFTTSKNDIIFADDVIVGNFVTDVFQIKNTGYREGELLSFEFNKNDLTKDGVNKAVCIATSASSTYLKCYEETLVTELTLEEFPFIVSQRSDCFNPASSAPRYINIDEQCILDVRFQPSVNYQSRKAFGYDLSLNYDSRWKGLVDLKTAALFEITSKALHAGKIIISNVEFDDKVVNREGAIIAEGIDDSVDLGRLALLSAGYETFRPIKITFHNIGGASIDVFRAFSGVSGGQMGLTELDMVTNKTVGNYSTKYFKDIKIDQSNCGNLGVIVGDPSGTPISKCSVSMLFAPISMSTTNEQNESMFDLMTGADPLKIFSFHYHDEANFSDFNFETEVPDISASNPAAWRVVNLGIKAELIEKGFLADYSKLGKRLNPSIIRDNVGYLNFIFTNIGTGPISWIPYQGTNIDLEGALYFDDGIKRVVVSDPAAYGATYDCNQVFDFDFNNTNRFDPDNDGNPATANDASIISTRLSGKPVLSKLESCVLRVKFEDTTSMLRQSKRAVNETNNSIGNYIYSSPQDNTLDAYNLRDFGVDITKYLAVSFFDGDSSGQAAAGSTNEFELNFGEYFEVGSSHLKGAIVAGGDIDDQARVVASDPQPYMSAVTYRPEINYPSYNRLNNGNTQTIPASTIPAEYYAALNVSHSLVDCDYYKSCESPIFVENSRLNSDFDMTGIDYLFHAGTFPTGKDISFQFSLGNASGNISGAKYSGEQLLGAPEIMFSANHTTLNNQNLNSAQYPIKAIAQNVRKVLLEFNAAAPGIYTSVYQVSYNTGRGNTNQNMTFKVRVVAEALATVPVLDISYADYDADGNLLATKYPLTKAYNHDESPGSLIFEAAQLTTADPTGPALKKRIYIENNGSVTASSLNISFKDDPISVTNSSSVGANSFSSKAIKIVGTDCTISADFNFTAGSQCYIDIWYQPTLTDLNKDISLSMKYDTSLGRNQFIQENSLLTFTPLSPSVIEFANTPLQNIQYKDRENGDILKSGQKAYVINLGNVTYDQINKEFITTRELLNPGVDTRASLVRQYEKLNGITNPNLDPSSVTYDGNGYVEIYNAGAVRAMVNSVCLFGGTNEAASPNSQKGFNGDTTEQCFIKISFTPGINIIGRSVSFTNVQDVSDFYFYLEYYNNKRDSFDKVYVTFTGKFAPPISNVSMTPFYSGVYALTGGEVGFSWQDLTPSSPLLGPISGYRIYYTKFPGEISSMEKLIEGSAKFVDVYGQNDIVLLDSYIQNLTSYYLKVVAIRDNPGYTAGLFPGLSTGLFLSEAINTSMKVTIPSSEFFYDYFTDSLILYDKLSGIYDYFGAVNACQGEGTILISDNGASVQKFFELIGQDHWDSIALDFISTTDYGSQNPRGIPHWIYEGLNYNIDSIFGAGQVPGYDPTLTYQRFGAQGLFYIRSSAEAQAMYGPNVAKTEGGWLNFLDYEGYISPVAKEAFARCAIPMN